MLDALAYYYDTMAHEDNQVTIRVVQTGMDPTTRYLGRTHRISVAWLHEVFQNPQHKLVYEESGNMCADICTEEFSDFRQLASRLRYG